MGALGPAGAVLRVLRVLWVRVLWVRVLRVRALQGRALQARALAAVLVLVALVSGLGVWARCGPIPRALLDGVDPQSTVVVDRHGRVLYEALGKDGSRIKPIDAATLRSEKKPPELPTR